jgi:hypothetical protein
MAQIQMTEDEWDEKFTLIENHIQGYGTQLFETYGEELAFVISQPADRIWTMVDTEGNGTSIISGMWLVNRIGYFISEESFSMDDDIEICIQEGEE